MQSADVDAVVIGAGVVGLATALALLALRPNASLVVLEKESELAAHQTGHNSGVIHAGLYYKPGSRKATMAARGRSLLERFCEEHGVPFERCGKVVVATRKEEVARLDELERRGRANGLSGLARLTTAELREREPHAAGVAALLVPETGIVDYTRVARAFAKEATRRGAIVRAAGRVTGLKRTNGRVVVESTAGAFEARVTMCVRGARERSGGTDGGDRDRRVHRTVSGGVLDAGAGAFRPRPAPHLSGPRPGVSVSRRAFHEAYRRRYRSRPQRRARPETRGVLPVEL